MPVFITQGRFTQDAVKGMMAKPEDRAEAVGQLFAKAGGKLLSYYMTLGDTDFLIISEGPMEGALVSAIVASGAGSASHVRTTLAIPSSEMKDLFGKAGKIASTFRTPGGK
jgi:uncharacterized protein with GYD domain